MSRKVYFVTKKDYANNLNNKSITEVAESSNIATNKYSWNESLKAFRINNDTAVVKGTIDYAVGYFRAGDRIKVSGEFMSVSGVKPKIAINKGNVPSGENLGNVTILQTKKQGVFEPLELTITCLEDGYYRMVTGTFTADIGDWYVRDLSIECFNRTNNFVEVTDHEKTSRDLIFLANSGNFSVVEGYSNDKATTVVNLDKSVSVTFSTPFTYIPFSPLTISATNKPYSHTITTTSPSPNGFKFWIYTKDGALVDPKDASLVALYITIISKGYDYKNIVN